MPPPPPPPPPSAAPTPAPATGSPLFDFGKPFTFVFEDPNWLQKILIGGLFYLAGFLIVGWFFIAGYAAKLARNVVAGVQHPLPEWDDIGGYFGEGLRIIGVFLVYVLPMVAVALMFMVPAGILGAVFEGHEGVEAISSVMLGCLACLLVPFWLAMLLLMPASLLFAAMEQRFGAAFEFGRIWPFIRANIGNYLLAIVIYLIARFLSGFGIILLCIGVIFTGFWSITITAHAFGQVWRAANPPKQPAGF